MLISFNILPFLLKMALKSQRDVNWRPQEDETLCKGWISIAKDRAIGINQPNDSFWQCVYQIFLKNDTGIVGPKPRTSQAIASRLKTINRQYSLTKA